MIESGRARLVVWSTDTESEAISELLGVEPTEVIAKGSVSRSGRVREQHTWSLDVDNVANTGDDQTGTGPLSELLIQAHAAAGRVSSLPADCEARISWHGSSDSGQGGFVFSAVLARQIADVGVDLYATVYLDEGGIDEE